MVGAMPTKHCIDCNVPEIHLVFTNRGRLEDYIEYVVLE